MLHISWRGILRESKYYTSAGEEFLEKVSATHKLAWYSWRNEVLHISWRGILGESKCYTSAGVVFLEKVSATHQRAWYSL